MESTFQQRVLFIRDIESELNAIPHDGIPVGSLLSDTLLLKVLQAPQPPSCWAVMKDIVRLCRWMFRSLMPPADTAPLAAFHGRVCFTLLSGSNKLKDLILPIADQFPGMQQVIAGCSSQTDETLTSHPYFPAHRYLHGGSPKTLLHFLRMWPRWRKAIRQVCDRHEFGCRPLPHLRLVLFAQLLHVAQAKRLIRALQPTCVVTEYDRNGTAACLVLAARKAGIPTVTLIHGIVNPDYGYTPLLADIALCWGEQHREKLMEGGTPPERLAIAGNPRLKEKTPLRRETPQKTECGQEKPTILFASQALDAEKRHGFMDAFCQVAARLYNSADFRVRLHPSEKTEFYQEEQQKYPFVKIESCHGSSVEDSIAAADYVVTWGSGFGYDALVYGTPVILFNLFNEESKHVNDLIQKAKCPVATSPMQLAELITGLLSTPETRGMFHEKSEEFSRYFVYARGEWAAKNSAAQIRAQIAKQRA